MSSHGSYSQWLCFPITPTWSLRAVSLRHVRIKTNKLTCTVQYLIQTKSRIGQATPYIVFYHIFLVMAVWSYIRVVFTDPGRPPKADASREGAARKEGAEAAPSAVPIQLPLHYACDELGRPRWCDHCKVIKPNRTHHDSESGRCVTKMDHFCPWICNTVGARNHKFFLQFCIYALVFVAYVFATTLPVVIELTNAYTLPAVSISKFAMTKLIPRTSILLRQSYLQHWQPSLR